jgi:hypothetical protein
MNRFTLCLVTILFLVICMPLNAQELSLDYDCSFEIPMSSPYPPEVYDPSSDGIFHITSTVRSRKSNGHFRYTVKTIKKWPVLSNNESVSTNRFRRIERRNKIYRLGILRLIAPFRQSISATYTVFNSELYVGGACASCSSKVAGTCRRASRGR